MKTRKTKSSLWTARNIATLALIGLAAIMALVGCPVWAWAGPCNVSSLLLLDVI